MTNLLELGKSMVYDIVNTYKDSFFEYVDENSLDDETYMKIGKALFEDKEKFLDYMNHLYLEDFDWHNSEVESFEFIQEIVDVSIGESGKYVWYNRDETYVPVVEYQDALQQILNKNLVVPCAIENSAGDISQIIHSYDKKLKGYNIVIENEEEDIDVFVEDEKTTTPGIPGIYDYINNIFFEPSQEIASKLSLYLEIDKTKWKVDENGIDMIDRSTNQKIKSDTIFYEFLEELLEKNPAILKKYGIKSANSNIYDVKIQ